MFNIVLFHPEIPQNTGNIARTCAVSGAKLHLIKPLGFSINEKKVKRAGLDYWDSVDIFTYDNFDDFLQKNPTGKIYLITSKGDRIYSKARLKPDDYFVFGSETSGLPVEIHERYPNTRLKIPMRDNKHARCLNLSNAVAVVLYEALRQTEFKNLI